MSVLFLIALTHHVTETQELKDTLHASAERIQELESQLEEKTKLFRAEQKVLSKRAEDAENTLRSLRDRFGQKDETMIQIVDETKRVEKERNELRNRSRDLEEEVANLRAQVNSLEARLVLLDEENEKSEREMKSTRVAVSAHETNARSLKARLESVQEERDKLWREIESLRDTIRTLVMNRDIVTLHRFVYFHETPHSLTLEHRYDAGLGSDHRKRETRI